MKFGITLANSGRRCTPEFGVMLAQTAEELGFESLWTVEHTVVPIGYESRYPYSIDGRMPGEGVPIGDPLIWLAYAAAVTQRIRLATGIVILPQRNPLTLAKEISTLDVLSGGRVILGIGIGWLREEFDALGVAFEDRAARTDEYVDVMRTVWRQDEPSYAGATVRFGKLYSSPKPAQAGGPPIVVGGHSEAAARRAGRIGDGFFPYTIEDPLEAVKLFDVARQAARDAGRDPGALEFTTAGAMDLDGAKRFADAGVHRLVIPPLGKSSEDLKQFLGTFAENVIQPLR
ncbi:MAG: LLM class F420-dependent oxidoreductase [Actinomycetota bacterium]